MKLRLPLGRTLVGSSVRFTDARLPWALLDEA